MTKPPEILTDREVPATPTWENRDDEDEDDSDDVDTGDSGNDTPEVEDDDTEPDAGTGTEHINNTPADTEAALVAASPLTPWPFPTADGMNGTQSGTLAA